MNYKLLLGLILLSIVILPYLPALAQGGQIPTTIYWSPETSQDTGVLRAASGDVDIFFWTVRKTLIPTFALVNLTLIPSFSTYNTLVFNVAQNVIDPNLPGTVTVYRDKVFPGQYIPGLVLVDPDKWFETDPMLATNFNVNITDITEEMYVDLTWNPFAIREVRFAVNWLVDRAYVAGTIYGGAAVPKYCAILTAHPQYVEMFKDICEGYGFTISDPGYAKAIFETVVQNVNATLNNYNFTLIYIDGVLHLAKIDLTWVRRININFMIRTEDERLEIGRHVADNLRTYFNLWVNNIERPRPGPIRTAYYTNPVKRDPFGTIPTGDDYEPRIWHIYTEGWVTTAEEPWHWLRWTITFFYLPDSGYGPNHWRSTWWYWYCNDTVWALQYKLNYYTYVNETELKNDILSGLRYGIEEAIRVFIVDEINVYPAYRYTLTDVIAGYTGLASPWALRTLRFTKPEVKFLQFSATGALFMSWWNPLTGFTDIYSEYIHRFLADFDYWINPATGTHDPMRVESYYVKQTYPANISLAEVTGYVYDPIQEKWVYLWEANDKWVKATWEAYWGYSYDEIVGRTLKFCSYVETRYKSKDGMTLGYWHDGSAYTIADLIYGIAFSYEWSFDDEIITGEPDPYYWDELAPAYGLHQYFGFKIINWTSMAYWYDYADVVPVYVADAADAFADMPWHLLYAGEELIVSNGAYGTLYGWSTIGPYTAVDYIDPKVALDVKKALENIRDNRAYVPKIPKYFNYPDPYWASALITDVDARYSNAIRFIETYKHAYVSQGPYYVESYDPVAFTMVIKRFDKYQFPEIFDYIFTTATAYRVISIDKLTFKDRVFVELGDRLEIEFLITIGTKYPAVKPIDVNLADLTFRIDIYNKETGEYLGTLPSQYITITVQPDKSIRIKIEVPPEYLKQLVGGTLTTWNYYVYYPETRGPAFGSFDVDIITRLTPPPAPEPTILPLIILIALLAILLIIKRK